MYEDRQILVHLVRSNIVMWAKFIARIQFGVLTLIYRSHNYWSSFQVGYPRDLIPSSGLLIRLPSAAIFLSSVMLTRPDLSCDLPASEDFHG